MQGKLTTLYLHLHIVRKDQYEGFTLSNHSSTRSSQAAKLRFSFVCM